MKKILATGIAFATSTVLFTGTAMADLTGTTTADIVFEAGTLSMEQISAFSFGSQTVSGILQIYPAIESRVFLNVHDLRGSGAGWRITALASNFNPEAPTLRGAVISLINGTAVSDHPGSPAPSVQPGISLDAEGLNSDNVALASLDRGLGDWSIEWNGDAGDNRSVTLSVPGGVATVGTHRCTITWTLIDAP